VPTDIDEAKEANNWRCLLLLPVFDTLCTYLEPQDLLAIRRTTKELGALYSSICESQFNVNRLLKRFVADPVALRSKLATHDALISGSVALQLFERVVWSDSDLDIYIEYKSNNIASLALHDHFTMFEGYAVTKFLNGQPHYEETGNTFIVRVSRTNVHNCFALILKGGYPDESKRKRRGGASTNYQYR
jgi:hypothetical protein